MIAQPPSLFTPIQRLVIAGLLVAGLAYGVNALKEFLLPFFISFVLAYLLMPVVDRMEFVFRRRIVAVVVLYAVFFGCLFVGARYLMPIVVWESISFSKALPSYLVELKQSLDVLDGKMESYFPYVKNFGALDKLQDTVSGFLLTKIQAIPNLFVNIFYGLYYMLLIPFVMFFILLQGEGMTRSFVRVIPNQYLEMILNLFYRIDRQLGLYLRGILVETLLVGGVSGLCLFGLGLNFSFIVGMMIGIFNMVPYVGPLAGIVVAGVIYYFQIGDLSVVLSVAALLGAVQVIDNIIFKPFVYSRSNNLHPIFVLFAIVVGGAVGGVLGMLLAVPVAVILKIVGFQLYREAQFRYRLRLQNITAN